MTKYSILTLPLWILNCGTAPNSTSTESGRNSQDSPNYVDLELSSDDKFLLVNQINDEENGIQMNGLSLREAIAIANQNSKIEIIQFDPKLAGKVIPLTKGQISIKSSIKLVAPPLGVTIDAGTRSRIFRISQENSDIQVWLENLNFKNGVAPDEGIGVGSTGFEYPNIRGGAIYNTENLTIVRSTFFNNKALRGGAIVSDGGSLTVSQSQFTENRAGEFGGGIVFDTGSFMTVEDTLFTNNEAGTIQIISTSLPNYSVPVSRYLGGAIVVDPESYTLKRVTFSSNRATNGGAVYHFQSMGLMEDCLFKSSNSATSAGQAIWSFAGTLSLVRTEFEVPIGEAIFNLNGKTKVEVF